MSVYRRKKGRKAIWYADFQVTVNGITERVQKSTRCTNKETAEEWVRREKERVVRMLVGLPAEPEGSAINTNTMSAAIDQYLSEYQIGHRPNSIKWATARLERVREHLGNMMVAAVDRNRLVNPSSLS